MTSYVYLLKDKNNPAYKIGKANDIPARMKKLEQEFDIDQCYGVECQNAGAALALEKILHLVCDNFSINILEQFDGYTEWFQEKAFDLCKLVLEAKEIELKKLTDITSVDEKVEYKKFNKHKHKNRVWSSVELNTYIFEINKTRKLRRSYVRACDAIRDEQSRLFDVSNELNNRATELNDREKKIAYREFTVGRNLRHHMKFSETYKKYVELFEENLTLKKENVILRDKIMNNDTVVVEKPYYVENSRVLRSILGNISEMKNLQQIKKMVDGILTRNCH